MTTDTTEQTSIYIDTDIRAALQTIGEHLRRQHGGRGGISRGIRHVTKVYAALSDEARQAYATDPKYDQP